MPNLEKLIEEVKEQIVRKTNPVSIFLYGSYNTSEYLPGVSDLELGVIKKGEESISKTLREIADKYSSPETSLRIYPYDLEKLKRGDVDTPFTKSVFMRHTILVSKTIWGEEIMEKLLPPPIDLIDAYREVCFSTSRALGALFFLRAGRTGEAVEMGYKSCLFATLGMEYLLGEFPIGFKNMVEVSEKLNLEKEWENLVRYAYSLRKGEKKPTEDGLYEFIFKTISYCNQIAEVRVKNELEKGNRVLIK